MPRDDASRYFVPGAFGTHTISRMSRMSHSRAANSSRMYPRPYPSALSLIERIDQAGDGWYGDCTDDLHLHDFIWFTRMQTTRRCLSVEDNLEVEIRCWSDYWRRGLLIKSNPTSPMWWRSFA